MLYGAPRLVPPSSFLIIMNSSNKFITANHDLDAQQQHLSSIKYDLRITNLARFIYKKVIQCHPGLDPRSRNNTLDSRLRGNDKLLKLIDIGAGNGLFLKFFKEKGLHVSGIELEKENVENMLKDPQLSGVDIKQGDITQLTGHEEYDVVIASDVIEHIEQDETAIEHLWSFVAPGGILIITVPAHAHLYGKRDEAWGHFRRYDKDSLKLKVTSLEFGNVEFITFWNTIGYFVYFLFERILHKPINEKMRYSNSVPSRVVKGVLDFILRIEETLGGTRIGLTLIVGVRKEYSSEK